MILDLGTMAMSGVLHHESRSLARDGNPFGIASLVCFVDPINSEGGLEFEFQPPDRIVWKRSHRK